MNSQKILAKFREYLQLKHHSENTISIYSIAVKMFLDNSNKSPGDITQEDVNKYVIYMKGKYEQNSLVPMMYGINHFMKFIGKKIHAKPPRYISKNRDVLTQEEIQELFDITQYHPRNNAIIKTLYYTGIRRTELTNLNMSDIDFKNQKVRINAGKGNTYEIINIHPKALDSIERYLKQRPQL